jgi:hypothetical protein
METTNEVLAGLIDAMASYVNGIGEVLEHLEANALDHDFRPIQKASEKMQQDLARLRGELGAVDRKEFQREELEGEYA